MAIYSSEQEFYVIMGKLFERLQRESDGLDEFAKSHLVVRICLQDPVAEVLVDGRQPQVYFGQRPGRADLELHLSTDLLHQIWLGEASLRASFFSGQIKTQGNVMQALALGPLFQAAERVYPLLLREEGLLE